MAVWGHLRAQSLSLETWFPRLRRDYVHVSWISLEEDIGSVVQTEQEIEQGQCNSSMEVHLPF